MQEDKNVKKKGFLKGMRAELKKVIWPTGKQTVKSTFVTIAFALLISVILIVLNLIFSTLNELWINSISGGNTVINNIVSGESGDEVIEIAPDTDSLDEIASGEEIDIEELSIEDLENDAEVSEEMVSGE